MFYYLYVTYPIFLLHQQEFRYERVREAIEKSGSSIGLKKFAELGPPPFLKFDSLTAFSNLLTEFVGIEGTFRNIAMDQLNEAVAKNKEYTETEMASSIEGMKAVFNALSEYVYTQIRI